MDYDFSTTLNDILNDYILDIDEENNIFFNNENKFCHLIFCLILIINFLG